MVLTFNLLYLNKTGRWTSWVVGALLIFGSGILLDLRYREFGHYCGTGYACSNLSSDENTNILSAPKELLLWHWKSSIFMQQVQELMRVVEMREPDCATP